MSPDELGTTMRRLTFLVHRGKDYTVRKYLRSWGREFEGRIDVRHYPDLRSTGRTRLKRLEQTLRAWRVGTLDGPPSPTDDRRIYVFADLERLDPGETEAAVALHDALADHPDTAGILNHPTQSMRRFELLDSLHRDGVNDFGVHRASLDVEPARWPVFVRAERDHGVLSGLLPDAAALRAELERLRGSDGLEGRIVIEFRDTADESGLVRKYGAFRVDDRILARQIHFSRHWMLRVPDIVVPETAREELEYVEANPHAAELMPIFERANVRYGRIDYAIADGRIQVWEINTNPGILLEVDRRDPLRHDAHAAFARVFNDTIRGLLGA